MDRGFELVTVSELLGIQPAEEATTGIDINQPQK
jgi:hypothetical protein